MNRRVIVLPAAVGDVHAIASRYLREAGIETADRFVRAFFETAESLGRFSSRGRAVPWEEPAFRSLRSIPIRGFEALWLFYRVRPGTIDVARVVHGARDLARQRFD